MAKLNNKSTMPKAILKKWLKALRSGEYKKGKGSLYNNMNNEPKFCCLGVLQHCVTGGVEFMGSASRGFPTMEWLQEYDIHFRSNDEDTNNPSLQMGNGVIRTAASINDSGKYSFAKIADYIENSFIGT